MSRSSGTVLREIVPSAGRLSADELRAMARSGRSDDAVVAGHAWRRFRGDVPPDIAEKLPRGAFLEAVLDLCETCLGYRLRAWTIEYTSRGGPYVATLHLDLPARTIRAASDLSAAAAFVVALLDCQERRAPSDVSLGGAGGGAA